MIRASIGLRTARRSPTRSTSSASTYARTVPDARAPPSAGGLALAPPRHRSVVAPSRPGRLRQLAVPVRRVRRGRGSGGAGQANEASVRLGARARPRHRWRRPSRWCWRLRRSGARRCWTWKTSVDAAVGTAGASPVAGARQVGLAEGGARDASGPRWRGASGSWSRGRRRRTNSASRTARLTVALTATDSNCVRRRVSPTEATRRIRTAAVLECPARRG